MYHFLNYCFHKKIFNSKHLTCEIYIENHASLFLFLSSKKPDVSFPISIFSCQAAVTKAMSAYPRLLVKSILAD